MQPPNPAGRRSAVALEGAMGLIAVLLMVQMWLLTATLENFLGGHREVAAPAAALSGVLFAGCCGLYAFVVGVDRDGRRARVSR